MNDIPQRLRELHGCRRHVPSVGGQQCGLENYSIRANGNTLEVLYEAAEEIERLEHEVASLAGSHIASECPYCARSQNESSKGGDSNG